MPFEGDYFLPQIPGAYRPCGQGVVFGADGAVPGPGASTAILTRGNPDVNLIMFIPAGLTQHDPPLSPLRRAGDAFNAQLPAQPNGKLTVAFEPVESQQYNVTIATDANGNITVTPT
jgi:hypothetical protein